MKVRFILSLFLLFCAVQTYADTAQINQLLRKSYDLQRTEQSKSLKLAEQALSLSKKSGYSNGMAGAYIRIGSILYTNGKLDTSKQIIQKAQVIYQEGNNAKGVSQAFLLLGYIYNSLGWKDSAFEAMYAALRWNEKVGNKVTEGQIHINLGNLFLEYKFPEKALTHFQLALTLSQKINNQENLISSWDGLGRYYLEVKSYKQALTYFEKVDATCRSIGDIYSVAQNLTNIALCHELLKDFENAKKYYREALNQYLRLNMTDDIALAEYNLGNLFLQMKSADSAIYHAEKAIQMARISEDILSVARSLKLLSEAFAFQGNYPKAYVYQKQSTLLSDSILNAEKVHAIAEMQTKYETEKKEQKIVLLDAQNKAKNAQRNIFIVGTILSLLLAAAIFTGLVKTRKEKKISESLLLNILPSEVADELKSKGSADAQYFDEVTVLFTDFKDFTQITEKLNPSELVQLLHECFKNFDLIITKHRVEKIKTIGDSYMCAGGLPVPNKSFADDVVNAALEIQAYMYMLNNKRISEGKTPVEMRLGIHTGPVVAGIVGVKKFAYDIWGDTVNTASRIESSGAVGKVNISDSTYHLVKDKFICTPRGKIAAKHKGDIEMYFVEGRI